MTSVRCIGSVVHGTHVSVQGRNYLVPVPSTYRTQYMNIMDLPSPGDAVITRVERYERRRIHIPMVGRGLSWKYSEEVLTPEWMSLASTAAGMKDLGLLYEPER